MNPEVAPFHHAGTGSWSYVVTDPETRESAIIDPVLDYDWRSARTATAAADAVVAHCRQRGLRVRWLLETHAHADHLSAAQHLKRELGGEVAIGAGITSVQRTFKKMLGLGDDFAPDGRQFDRLLADGETLPLGSMRVEVIATPGHTSDCVSYLAGDAVFVGDTLFMPDTGSARCDFPGGDPALLFRSVRDRLYALPAATRLFVCHDYAPPGRAPACESTVGAQRRGNVHLRDDTNEAAFVRLRRERDAGLDVPNLIIPAMQVNLRAGSLPPPGPDGTSYLRVPLNVFGRPH